VHAWQIDLECDIVYISVKYIAFRICNILKILDRNFGGKNTDLLHLHNQNIPWKSDTVFFGKLYTPVHVRQLIATYYSLMEIIYIVFVNPCFSWKKRDMDIQLD